MDDGIIYHYCSLDTFQSILRSKKLWLCDLTDSNDDEEMIRTFNCIWDLIKKRLRTMDLDKDVLEKVIGLIDRHNSIDTSMCIPYGVCFSLDGDSSAMWKEYGDNTKGVSIGFGRKWFVQNNIANQMPCPNAAQTMSVGISDVVYDVESLVSGLSHFFYEMIKMRGVNAWMDNIRYLLKCVSGFTKNDSFRKEEEVRIVYYPVPGSHDGCIIKPVSNLKTEVTPHYEIDWKKDDSNALCRIVIGHNSTICRDDLHDMLEGNDVHTQVDIAASEYTYRIK